MARLSLSLVLLSILSSSLVSATPQVYDEAAQAEQHKDASCDNGCFFDYFTNMCNEDNPACMCTLEDRRQKYFCCMAKKCDSHVLPDSLERQFRGCNAWNIPIPEEFDTEAICGIKMPSTSTSTSAAASSTSDAASQTSAASQSAAASSAASSAGSSAASSVTPPASSVTPPPQGSQTTPGAPASTNPDSGAVHNKAAWGGAAVVLGAAGMMMW